MTDVKFTPPRGTIGLEAEVTVIVPSTKGVREQRKLSKSEMDRRVDIVRRYLSVLFGGYTSVTAVGGYVMQKGKHLVQEDVVMVKAFGDEGTFKAKQNKLIKKLQIWCKDFQQETIGVVVETDFYMIKRK